MGRKLLYGFGINDYYENPVNDGHKIAKFYQVWRSMIARCYDEKQRHKYKSYKGCEVCDEWKYVSNFKKWFDENYIEGCDLDKDILVKGNRLYSPSTCCFVPKELNRIFEAKPKKIEGNTLPEGVMYEWGRAKYISYINTIFGRKYIGRFDNIEDAADAYSRTKADYVIELAKKYYTEGRLHERVYKAIVNRFKNS